VKKFFLSMEIKKLFSIADRGLKILALAMLLPALFASCTKSGALTGGTAGSGSSNNAINGSVNGGLSPVAGASVSLFAAGNSTPLAAATTTTSGAFTLNYTNPGSGLFYVRVTGGNAGGGSNTSSQFLAFVGSGSTVSGAVPINELTTGAVLEVGLDFGILSDKNGLISLSAPTNSTVMSNVISQYSNLVSTGQLNTANANLVTASQQTLSALADAFSSCVERLSGCQTLFSTAANASGTAAATLLEAGYNVLTNTTITSSVYNLGAPLGGSTGFTIPSSAPGGFSFNMPMAATAVTFPLTNPYTIAFDSSGNAWIAAESGDTVTKYSPTSGVLGQFTAGLTNPTGVAIDANGNVWVSDHGGGNVAELSPSGTLIGTFAAVASQSIAIDSSGNIWVPQYNTRNANIIKLNSSGTQIGTFPDGDDPEGIGIDASGNIWISDRAQSGSPGVRELNSAGTTLGIFPFPSGSQPIGVGIDPSGNVWIGNFGANSVTELSSGGGTLATYALSSGPVQVGIDTSGNVWSGLYSASKVKEISSSGLSLASYAIGSGCQGLAIDASGNVWASSAINNKVTEYLGVSNGPQFFPYSGPQFPFNSL